MKIRRWWLSYNVAIVWVSVTFATWGGIRLVRVSADGTGRAWALYVGRQAVMLYWGVDDV